MAGRVVMISGSSRGIGAATARAAAREGARVILHGRTPTQRLEDMAAALDAPAVTADVADAAAITAAIADGVAQQGPIDCLINCAGSVRARPFLEATDDDWLREINVNLMGAVHPCRAVAPGMVERGYGRIVNVASIRGERSAASARGMAYSAAKAAVSNFTAALAKELAPSVTVNAVSPGFVRTDMSASWNDAVWNQARSALVGRLGEPEDIAELLIFLASDRAAFITGQTIVADGGYTIAGK